MHFKSSGFSIRRTKAAESQKHSPQAPCLVHPQHTSILSAQWVPKSSEQLSFAGLCMRHVHRSSGLSFTFSICLLRREVENVTNHTRFSGAIIHHKCRQTPCYSNSSATRRSAGLGLLKGRIRLMLLNDKTGENKRRSTRFSKRRSKRLSKLSLARRFLD